MDLTTFALSAILSLTPISELRGAIPLAVARGMPVWLAGLWCVAWNALAGPIAFLFLASAHKLLYRWRRYAGFFDRFVERAREKVRPEVEKFGYWGLLVFVAIPLPLTGAWTGVLGGWMLGMPRRKVLVAVAAGVAIAGIVVSLVVGLGVQALSFLVKRL